MKDQMMREILYEQLELQVVSGAAPSTLFKFHVQKPFSLVVLLL